MISLHSKIQELTNHVAVLQNKIEQISKNAGDGSEIEMSFHHSIHDAIDDHHLLIHFKLTAPDQGLKDVTRLRNLLHISNTKMWDKLTGGGDSCFFAKDLKKHPLMYNYVMIELRDYITYVQQIYSKLNHVKGGAILSSLNTLAQIDGHYGKLPSNYTANVLERPPDERPILIIVAVDPFGLQYLPSQEMKRKDMKRLNVNQGEMVMFTNTCLHSGDTNESDHSRLRLFGYMVSHEEDFPKNEVM